METGAVGVTYQHIGSGSHYLDWLSKLASVFNTSLLEERKTNCDSMKIKEMK